MDEGEDEGGVLERAGAALRIVGMKADKVRKDFYFWGSESQRPSNGRAA